ncbi:MAG TPA: hypothetical protein VF915_24225 [Reyranella sp.]
MQATRGSIQFLGRLSGAGALACDGEDMGRATFEIDGFRTRTGEVVGSGEIRMIPAELDRAFGRTNLTLTTDEGRVLAVRFSGKRHNASENAAHADITGDLPAAKHWQR